VTVLSARIVLASPTFELDVAFEVPPGVTVLFGPSGAGKSRTLAGIAGLIALDRGLVTVGDEVWFDAERRISMPIHRRRVGYVFQSFALFPHLTALQNVVYGIPRELPAEERRTRARAMLEKMHVAKLADRHPRTFSGGEAQRVALARAFAMGPRVVLLDEPFTALDRALKKELMRDLRERLASEHVPSILVTHDPGEAEALGERVIFIDRGRVVETSSIGEASLRTPR
jgi:molybdate transport system ATP-binding protein